MVARLLILLLLTLFPVLISNKCSRIRLFHGICIHSIFQQKKWNTSISMFVGLKSESANIKIWAVTESVWFFSVLDFGWLNWFQKIDRRFNSFTKRTNKTRFVKIFQKNADYILCCMIWSAVFVEKKWKIDSFSMIIFVWMKSCFYLEYDGREKEELNQRCGNQYFIQFNWISFVIYVGENYIRRLLFWLYFF